MSPDFKLGLLIGSLSVIAAEMWVLILIAWWTHKKKLEQKS